MLRMATVQPSHTLIPLKLHLQIIIIAALLTVIAQVAPHLAVLEALFRLRDITVRMELMCSHIPEAPQGDIKSLSHRLGSCATNPDGENKERDHGFFITCGSSSFTLFQ